MWGLDSVLSRLPPTAIQSEPCDRWMWWSFASLERPSWHRQTSHRQCRLVQEVGFLHMPISSTVKDRAFLAATLNNILETHTCTCDMCILIRIFPDMSWCSPQMNLQKIDFLEARPDIPWHALIPLTASGFARATTSRRLSCSLMFALFLDLS